MKVEVQLYVSYGPKNLIEQIKLTSFEDADGVHDALEIFSFSSCICLLISKIFLLTISSCKIKITDVLTKAMTMSC